MKRSKKGKTWNPKFGFCKGLANHSWSAVDVLIAVQHMFRVVELECTHCGTSRIDTIQYSNGRLIRRFYRYTKGYLRIANGKKLSKEVYRKEYLHHLVGSMKGRKQQ